MPWAATGGGAETSDDGNHSPEANEGSGGKGHSDSIKWTLICQGQILAVRILAAKLPTSDWDFAVDF